MPLPCGEHCMGCSTVLICYSEVYLPFHLIYTVGVSCAGYVRNLSCHSIRPKSKANIQYCNNNNTLILLLDKHALYFFTDR